MSTILKVKIRFVIKFESETIHLRLVGTDKIQKLQSKVKCNINTIPIDISIDFTRTFSDFGDCFYLIIFFIACLFVGTIGVNYRRDITVE